VRAKTGIASLLFDNISVLVVVSKRVVYLVLKDQLEYCGGHAYQSKNKVDDFHLFWLAGFVFKKNEHHVQINTIN
jgi:hypothetical protein